jgi:hypothetical protein
VRLDLLLVEAQVDEACQGDAGGSAGTDLKEVATGDGYC